MAKPNATQEVETALKNLQNWISHVTMTGKELKLIADAATVAKATAEGKGPETCYCLSAAKKVHEFGTCRCSL